MRILYVLNSSLPHVGATRAFMQLLPMLQAKGVEPVVSLPEASGIYEELKALHIETVVLPSRDGTWSYLRSFKDSVIFLPRTLIRRLMNWRATRRLVAYLREHPVDLIHTNVSVYDVGVRAADRLHIPHVFHVREFADRDFRMYYFPARSWYYRQYFRGENHYTLCITQCIRQHHEIEDEMKSSVVYDPISIPNAVVPYKAESDYFLLVGRMDPSKGVAYALEGYRDYVKSAKEPFPLYIVGSDNGGKYSQDIHRFVEEHHLSNLVHFLGVRSDVLSLMAGARALIISSEYEGFGLCMAEAQSVRCIVVARNTTGSAEQMANGRQFSGREIAFSFDTPQQLATQLLRVSTASNIEMDAMRDAAFSTVSTMYDPQRSAEQVISLYKSILFQ